MTNDIDRGDSRQGSGSAAIPDARMTHAGVSCCDGADAATASLGARGRGRRAKADSRITGGLMLASLALVLLAVPAHAGPLAYVININHQFGTVDLTSGAFLQIGPATPEGTTGLVAGPNGSLLTLAFGGNLNSIDPVTGVMSVVGPTGLADCATPASPCGPTATNQLGAVGDRVFVTDLQNNLYSVNPLTGATTLIGPTGIPAVPFAPGSMNADGTLNFYDQAFVAAGGVLYATFDAFVFDPTSFMATTVLVQPSLYRIDVSTGLATRVGPTDLSINAIVPVGGTYYAFNALTNQLFSLDLTSGGTALLGDYDPAAGVIFGASPAVGAVPEPASILLLGTALCGLVVRRWPRRMANT